MNSNLMGPSWCEPDLIVAERLQQLSPLAVTAFIFIIIVHLITFPFTVVLNALVMIAVKFKPRLRSHKSNSLLALLASTDFTVGAIVHPTFIVVLVMFLLEEPSAYCVLQVFKPVIGSLSFSSLLHLALISGERYLAMKHPFVYATLVSEVRLLAASVLAWTATVILHLPIAMSEAVFVDITNAFAGITIAFIFVCHVIVYSQTRRHKQQIAAQQVTRELREQFLRDKKAMKLTTTIIVVLILCYMPLIVFTVVYSRYRTKISLETGYILLTFSTLFLSLNSLLNPIIYSVRMRQFRLAMIELTCRTVNIAEAERIEMRVVGESQTLRRKTRTNTSPTSACGSEQMRATATMPKAKRWRRTKIALWKDLEQPAY